MSEEVLVPQAKSKQRGAGDEEEKPGNEGRSGGSTPMNSAPVMNRSPRMPPRPLGNGQLFGWGSAESAAASSITESGQMSRRARRRSGTSQRQVPAPGGERQKQDDRGEPQGLHGEVGEDGAPRPSTLRGAACVALLKLGS